jgi:hypothetical protein
MIQRTPIRRISAKRLAELGGVMPFSSIRTKRKKAAWNRLPEWIDPRSKLFPGGRQELHGADKTARRRELFERSDGRCEAKTMTTGIVYQGIEFYFRCNRPITWELMEWSHEKHGRGKRDDSMAGGIASCKPCHRAVHNPKSCPKKERQAC